MQKKVHRQTATSNHDAVNIAPIASPVCKLSQQFTTADDMMSFTNMPQKIMLPSLSCKNMLE